MVKYLIAAIYFVCGLSVLTPVSASSRDEAAIKTVIEAIAVYVDRGNFDLIGELYAKEITTDYTSLWGGSPRKMTKETVGPGWAAFIPGFDATKHDINNIVVGINGEEASGRADVLATHWLNKKVWQISGYYDFKLQKNGDIWEISDWRFTLLEEVGDRGLVDAAEKLAEEERNGRK